MSEGRILIDVCRMTDNQITRLRGDAGIAVAVTLPDTFFESRDDTPLANLEPGLVSLRCDDALEMAVALASIMSVVRATSPQAYKWAHALAEIFDGSRPDVHRNLPPEPLP